MPEFHVEESIEIAASPDDVFRTVRDFKSWRAWSPWLLAEPDTKLDYSADGSSYSWDGQITGAGSMTVVHEDPPHSIDCELRFLRPWKSTNTTAFRLQATDTGTRVTWTMRGSLPLFLFFMKRKMSAFVAADYSRGLAMLKDRIETGDIGFSLDFLGIEAQPECQYLGVRSQCPIPEIGSSMEQAMGKLASQAEAAGIEPSGAPFSIYLDWDPVAGRAAYIVGFPVEAIAARAPEGCTFGCIPATDTFRIRHTGAYRHLGNAWAAGMMHQQAKAFSPNRKIPPFEIYGNDPQSTPEEELVTTLHFPTQ
ncbi:SRPBCC family protein [Haloferula rosea]|uniref:SRPBCC family protein n=1 Tax=Haloferula rosea TaxID=490093 RepID=A0A934RCH2_9BACT|nr:SRPBCC family protein [Haloferula rosea]MBK1828607.1 SRPBCC family protein [Haloferula rosea]